MGKQLGGSLRHCKEIKQKRTGLRILFKENTELGSIDVVDIVIIGKREDLIVFEDAEKRLK